MLLIQEGKQLWRTSLRTFALCLALSLMMGTMAIAYGLHHAAERLYEQVESEYTTIAYIPSTPLQYLDMKSRLNKSYLSSKNPLILALNSGKFELETALAMDIHSRMMAYDDNLSGAVSDIADLNKPQNIAVFAIRCDEILASKVYSGISSVQSYYYNFTVEQTLAMHEDFTPPERIVMDTSHYNADTMTSALEIGKNYLIWGYYEDLGEGVAELTTALHILDDGRVIKKDWAEHGYSYLYFPNPEYPTHRLPFCAAYDGSPEEYIARDTTGMWKTLLEIIRISHASVQILSADHPYALGPFVDDHAMLSEGYFFTEEQLESGAHVALISDILAEKNGLCVGDTLNLHFYQSEYSDDERNGYMNGIDMMMPIQLWGESKLEDPAYRQEKSVSRAPVAEQDDVYTIVGIYNTDGWINRAEYLHPNTVIIPQASLTAAYTWDLPRFDRTFILPNGGVDAFEAELEEAGFGGMVHYYDQGYASIITGVEAICHSAMFIYDIVRILWILSIAMLLLLFVRMQIPTGRVKYRLGVGKLKIWGQMSFSAMLILLLSCLGGFVGSVLLYNRALDWMTQAEFTSFNTTFSTMSANADMLTDLLGMMGQTPDLFAKSCAVQLAILLALAVIFAAVASLRKRSFKQ